MGIKYGRVEEGREFCFRGDLYSQESTFPLVLSLCWLDGAVSTSVIVP